MWSSQVQRHLMRLYMSHNPPLRCTATISAHVKVAQASGTHKHFCSFSFEAFDEIPKENAKDLSGPIWLSWGFSWGTRFTGASRRKHPSSVSATFLSFRASCSELSSSSHRNAFYTAALQSEVFAPFQFQEVRKQVQTPLNS
jgi:hypothetical protein